MNWLIKLIFVAVSELIIAGVEYFADIINNVFDFMYQLNVDILPLDEICNYTLLMGITLTSFFSIKQGIDVYVLHIDGDPDADPLEFIERIAETVATIMCGQWFIRYLIGLASKLTKEVTALVKYENRSISAIFLDAFTKFLSMGTILAVIQCAFFIVILVAFIIFIGKSAKRGGELILFQAFIPLISIDKLTTNREKWGSFKTELMICIFGYTIQLFCFNVFMTLFAKVITVDGIGTDPRVLFAALAWLLIVLSAPKWLQKFIYSSGIGQVAKGGANSAAYLVPKLLK